LWQDGASPVQRHDQMPALPHGRRDNDSRTVMTGLVWGLLSIGPRRFFRSLRWGAWELARGPLPPFDLLGSARGRWAKPCQGRSRRRRGPKASLYEGSPTDDHRLARSRGRGMSVHGSLLRGALAVRRSASRIPDHEDCVVVGMRQLLVRVDSDGSRSGPRTHALDRHGRGVRRFAPSGRARRPGPGRVLRSGEVWISRRS
jgi:hypothetical protein